MMQSRAEKKQKQKQIKKTEKTMNAIVSAVNTKKNKVNLNNLTSAADAMEKAGMAWAAEQSEIVSTNGIDIPDFKLIYRGDNRAPLGVVGKDYEPVQNSDAFAFFDTICNSKGARYTTALEVKGGRKIVLQAIIPGNFEVRKGDSIAKHITLVNSHDRSCSLMAFYTPVRLFCMNQLHVAFKLQQGAVKIRHTASIKERMDLALQVFAKGEQYFEYFKQQSVALAQKIVDKAMVERFLNDVLGKPEPGKDESTKRTNQKNEITRLFESGKGNGKGSAWDLFNGVTEYIDHVRGNDEEKRLESAMFGDGAKMKQGAFEAAMSLIGVRK
jgi:phage/plasmid-like protein (TIGR03299 family)